MKCIGEDDLIRAELGDLTLNQARDVDAHVGACSHCANVRDEIRALTSDLGRLPTPGEGERFVERVMAARPSRTDSARRRHFGIPAFVAAAVVLLAAGSVTFVASTRGRNEAFSARGHKGATNARSRAPSAEVLVLRNGRLLPVSEQTLSSTDAFAVRYANPMRETRFLAAFAVDATGAVHWIFPEYTDVASNPSSIPLAPTEDERLLPQVVAPDKPAPGPMHVLTMITREPTPVKQIEKALQNAGAEVPAARPLARAYPDAIVREWSCSWDGR